MRGLILVSVVVAFASALTLGPSRAQGQQAAAPGHLQEAAEQYKRAYEQSGDVALLFRLGEVNREMGEDVAALRFYRTYLARDPRGPHRQAAERAARDLERKISGPAPVVAAAPPPVVAAPPPPAVARPAPPTPVSPSPPPAPTAHPAVDLRAQPTTARAPQSDTPLPRWLPWVGLGMTVGLAAGAVVSGLDASRRYDDLRASCGQTAEGCAPNEIDQVRTRALTTNLLWAGAGAAALATGVTVYVNAREVGFAGAWSF